MNPYVATVIGIMLLPGPTVLLGSQVPPSEQSFLRALGEIESGSDDYAVGKLGERSRYQIRRETWAECSNKSFSHAHNLRIAVEAAMNYSSVLSNRYKQQQGCIPDNVAFYIMWNWGYDNFRKVGFNLHRVPIPVLKAAHRFQNLVYKYQSNN